MSTSPSILPALIEAVSATLQQHAEEVTALDLAIGDGDHLVNLQRGIAALQDQSSELAGLDWGPALQKIGMILMSKVGGASGSLLGTLFLTMGKSWSESGQGLQCLAQSFAQGVDAVKSRGKSDLGEKTMLDVLIPVAGQLKAASERGELLETIVRDVDAVALAGVESTRELLATKGRASFLGERARGHLDAGAKTNQLMISAIGGALLNAGA